MILKTMSDLEIFNEVDKDFDAVLRKSQYLIPSIIRKQKKSSQKEISVAIDYISPRKNNWILIFKVNKRAASMSSLAYVKGDMTFYKTIPGDNDEHVLLKFTPHFVRRYQERFLKQDDLALSEVMKRYIKENAVYEWKVINDGKDLYVRSSQGISLGVKEQLSHNKAVVVCKTFITPGMLRPDQYMHVDDITKSLIEQINKDKQTYKI